jgi:hypothetical protein
VPTRVWSSTERHEEQHHRLSDDQKAGLRDGGLQVHHAVATVMNCTKLTQAIVPMAALMISAPTEPLIILLPVRIVDPAALDFIELEK